MENYQRQSLIKSVIVLGLSLFSVQSTAEVVVQVGIHNGNVTFSERDVILGTEPNVLTLVRTYNSRSLNRGLFGFGFSTPLETYFEVTPEGNIWMHEVGGGNTVLFNRTNFKAQELDSVVNEIVSKLKASPQSGGQAEDFWQKRKEVLMTDADVRIKTSRDLGIRFPNDRLAKLEWETTTNGQQNLFVKGNVWIRKRPQGGQDVFKYDPKTQMGWIIGTTDSNGKPITYERDAQNRVVEVTASGKKYSLKYNKLGVVSTITLGSGKSLQFEYKELSGPVVVLTKVTRADGSFQSYEYTSGLYVGDYNIKLINDGNRKTAIQYDLKKDVVSQIDNPDGTIQNYNFFTSDSNPLDNYGTKVKYTKDGKTIAETSVEYWWKLKGDGTRYLYKTEQLENNVMTRTVYSACCGLPLTIERGGRTTTFKYTDEGLLISKIKPDGETIELSYHKKFKKVNKVVLRTPASKKANFINYTYNPQGNLASAVASDGRNVKLTWDKKDRIKTLKEKSQPLIEFFYEGGDRATKIKQAGVGTVKLDYNESGQVRNFASEDGVQVAYRVTNAFQGLLTLIGAAAVPLTAD